MNNYKSTSVSRGWTCVPNQRPLSTTWESSLMFTSEVVLKAIFATQWLASSLAKRKTVTCIAAIMTSAMTLLFQLTARFLLDVPCCLQCSNMCYIVKIGAIVLNKRNRWRFWLLYRLYATL